MSPSKRALVLVSAALVAGCATAGTPAPDRADDGHEASLLTRYALGQCLVAAYPGTGVERDARAAAAGYLEFGSLPIEAYEDATPWPGTLRHARMRASTASRCTR